MTTYIFNFDSKTAQLRSQEEGATQEQLLWSVSRFQMDLNGYRGFLTEEEFFEFLAQEIEALFSKTEGKKLILHAIPRDRRRLDRYLSGHVRGGFGGPFSDRQAG